MLTKKKDKSKPPLVSVIVPAFNCEKYLGLALDSVVGQTYNNLEIIVVDDGSTDRSAEIAGSVCPPVTLISQENQGSAVARNSAMARASGEYIAFLDCDDLWHPQKIELQVAFLEKFTNVGLVYNKWLVTEDDRTDDSAALMQTSYAAPHYEIDRRLSGWIYDRLLHDCYVHTSSAMLRRSAAELVGGFDRTLRKGQDYDYWLRFSRQFEMYKLDCILSTYRIHTQSVTQRPSPENHGAIIVKKAIDTWGRTGPQGESASTLSVMRRFGSLWYGHGVMHLKAGSFDIATSSLRSAVRYCPWNLRYWYDFINCQLRIGGQSRSA